MAKKYLDETGVSRVWSKIKNRIDTTCLKLTGGNVTGHLTLEKGFLVHHSNAGAGSTGYIHLLRIAVTGTWCDAPIELKLMQRRQRRTDTVFIKFASTSSTDPALDGFSHTGDCDIYLVKSEVSTWDLWVKKVEANDSVSIADINVQQAARSKVNISLMSEFYEALPESNTVNTPTLATVTNKDTYLVYDKEFLMTSKDHVEQIYINGEDLAHIIGGITVDELDNFVIEPRIITYTDSENYNFQLLSANFYGNNNMIVSLKIGFDAVPDPDFRSYRGRVKIYMRKMNL